MAIKYIKYPGYMSKEVAEFCKDALVTENRDGSNVTGYFLKSSLTPHTMLMTNWYIFKDDDNNFGIVFRESELCLL